jgi:putative endonuclease
VPDLNKASPFSIKQTTGQEIESQVATYLKKQGFQLLHRNFRCRLGEIDLIGHHQNQLLFVEVRFRRNAAYGGAAASVDFRKQQKLIKTAQFFLLSHPKMLNCACRFDVVAVTLRNEADHELEIDWIQNAFC